MKFNIEWTSNKKIDSKYSEDGFFMITPVDKNNKPVGKTVKLTV